MSCLLRTLTGAGNVGHTQCECLQRRMEDVFIPKSCIRRNTSQRFQTGVYCNNREVKSFFVVVTDQCHNRTRVTGEVGEGVISLKPGLLNVLVHLHHCVHLLGSGVRQDVGISHGSI